MSHKFFENLPSKDLPWFRTYTNPAFNWSEYIKKVFDQGRAYREAFKLSDTCNHALESIAIAQAQTIDLLRLNELSYLSEDYIQQRAKDLRKSLNEDWTKIIDNPIYKHHYINRNSALSKDVYSILNIILNDI